MWNGCDCRTEPIHPPATGFRRHESAHPGGSASHERSHHVDAGRAKVSLISGGLGQHVSVCGGLAKKQENPQPTGRPDSAERLWVTYREPVLLGAREQRVGAPLILRRLVRRRTVGVGVEAFNLATLARSGVTSTVRFGLQVDSWPGQGGRLHGSRRWVPWRVRGSSEEQTTPIYQYITGEALDQRRILQPELHRLPGGPSDESFPLGSVQPVCCLALNEAQGVANFLRLHFPG